jgi:hypothetical protein
MNLTPFEAFLITHLVADWLFQTHWEAVNKAEKFLPLFVHSSIYTLCFIPAFYYFEFNWLFLLILFGTHMILDNRKFEHWWLKKIKGVTKDNVNDFTWNILLLGVDQSFHLLILGFLVFIS